MRNLLSTLLLSVLFFSARSQSITVSAPNGGEILYACQTYTITWTASGTSNFYDIDYSLNNGAIWASVATNINITNGQYVWTVPNVESSNCLIRVRDKNNPAIEDISNAVFSIRIPVVVTAPNGGESWLSGSQQAITWNIQGTSLTFNIDYSTNGGTTWTSVVTNLSSSTGFYNWTVPNTPSTNCLVRVRDAVTNCMQDVSNNVFTILPLTPRMTYPNGGQVFGWGQPISITWDAATYYGGTVRIEYSTDNGLTWTVISASTSNDGVQPWTIPANINSTTCLVKVSDATNLSLNDVSNANFSILAPTLTLVSPNGGESFLGCNSTSVQYTITNAVYITPTISLYYSTNGGSSWSFMTSISYSSGVAGTQSYSWQLPNLSSSQCLVRASSTGYPTMSDTSDAVFSIALNTPITVTAPNGGQTFAPNSSQTITWTNTAQASGLYSIAYSTNGGSSFTTIASNVSGNAWQWTSVPNTPSTNCLIRVRDAANSCKEDVSDAPFTISPLTPTVTYPNGGQVFGWGQSISITWDAATYYGGTVRIEYSTDNGLTWTVISASTSNDGVQPWTIPASINSTTCLVKVSDATNLSLNDVSNATFSILAPTLTLVSPNGGESFLGCNSTSVQYTITNAVYIAPTVTLYYSTNGGSSWSFMTSVSYSSGVAGTQSYSWQLPNLSSSQCLVRASSTGYPTMSDTSDALFSIALNTPITVTAPNGGETFAPNSSQTITWTNTAQASGLYNIAYSTNGGSSFTTIATNVSGNAWQWTSVPNTPSTNCLIRVRDAANSCKEDVSDAPFTIGAQAPRMTYPNGGEVFGWGQPISITWDAATYYGGTVRIEYSTDNGLTWTVISSATSNDGVQPWTIPANINSTTCLVKVSDATNLSLNDVSNSTFSILAPTLTLVSPNGGESFLGCNSTSVQYTVANAVYITPTISLYYSTNGGSSWSFMTSVSYSSGVAGTQSYSWQLPNLSSSQCLVRASSTGYPTMSDTSDALFSIALNTPITVTAPNGGETFAPNSSQAITWTNTAQASGLYNIAYSTNGGSSFTTIASNVSGNAWQWTSVPNTPSTNCLIRVRDAANSCKEDVSDAPFTIGAQAPRMTYPNGGQVFGWGQPISITWDAATYYGGTVRIEYSTDNGLTWTVISSATSNDGVQPWTIPANINSTTCLVKVSDASNLSQNDLSNSTFSILAPTLTLVSPNGGESFLGCNTTSVQYTITNAVYITPTVSLYYSTNGGSSWLFMTSVSYSSGVAGTQSYSWQLPNLSSSQCLVRASSTGYPTMSDTSDAVFSIALNTPITVTAPNGGQTFAPFSSQTITWTNTAQASGLYNIAYSTNGGSSFTTIASNVSGNVWQWTSVPNTPSTNCLIRVRDAANSCKEDVSDAPFTISPLTPTVTYPNGGQVFGWGQSISITWDAATYYGGTVRIEYSTDNGLTWTVISASTSNDGVQPWTIPANINSTTCLVKVSDASNLSLNDVSNATFSILAPTLTLVSPNGGESFLGCNSTSVQYTITNAVYIAPTVTLYYSTNGGSSWSFMTSVSYSSGVAGTQSYSWQLPNLSSSQCLVRASSTGYPTMSDTADAVFSIALNTPITVTSPNGGETFAPNSSQTITWTNTAQASGLYSIAYSTNGGSSFTTIASNVSGNAWQWTSVPNTPSTNCLIRVRDAANSCKEDVSDETFTISPLTPTVTYPNGGQSLLSLNTVNITWNAATYYGGTVRIEYSLDSGRTWVVISTSTTNDGTQSWTLPFANSNKCLVRVSDASNLSWNDVSNTTFSITPIIQLTNPNGGDELGACTQTSITFTKPASYTSFDLHYSINNGLSWRTITTGYVQTGTTGSYNWSIPNVSSSQALVRVSPNGSPDYGDISDAVFTIKPSVTLIQPNYGGTLVPGAVFPIRWNSEGISNFYDIAYSTAGSGGPWTNIVLGYNTATNTYNWTVPNILSTNCYIRITDNVNSCKQDISDLPFTISNTAQPIRVTGSNGLDTLNACQNYTIQWTESGAPIGNYNIDLSTNGGVSWSSIAANYATTAGSYNWIVPNTETEIALIRVSAAGNSAVFDVSDAAFTIRKRNIIASRDTTLCSAGNLQLTATGGTGSFTWTPATGLSNPNIANPVANINASVQYVVSATNGTCFIADTVRITLAKPIQVTVGVNTPVVCAGTTAIFTAHATDAIAVNYQWKRNNINTGTNDSVLTVNNLTSSDVITCTVSSGLPCLSNATSAGVTATAYPALGNDTTLTTNCISCTTSLSSLYNTASYPVSTWNTGNPAAVRVGVYNLIVSGGICRDTAVVNVNAIEANTIRGCATGVFYIQSELTGTTYQWQENNGNGYINITNNASYAGAQKPVLQLRNVPASYSGYQYRCLVNGVSFSAVKTLKIATVWTGAVSTAWNTAGNWSCGTVPDANTDVFIYDGVPNYPVVTTPVSCRSLTTTPGTAVSVNAGGSVLITGK